MAKKKEETGRGRRNPLITMKKHWLLTKEDITIQKKIAGLQRPRELRYKRTLLGLQNSRHLRLVPIPAFQMQSVNILVVN